MTVFSGCLKIIKSKIGITIMYFVIFTGISIAMQLNNSKQSVTDFQSKRMDIAFFTKTQICLSLRRYSLYRLRMKASILRL